MINPKDISNFRELDREYAKALKQVTTLKELKAVVEEYYPFAADAHGIVSEFSESDFEDYLEMRKEGAEHHWKVRQIVMPGVLFLVSVRAAEFKVPWGAMYNRLLKLGKIRLEGDKLVFGNGKV